MSKIGVPSIKSAPETISIGPSALSCRTSSRRTQESPMGFGRKGERVANTPRRSLPPRRGGRTVGDQLSRTASENSQISQRWEKSAMPRRASGLRNSGAKTTAERRAPTSPLWRGMPNFSAKSLCIRAMTRMVRSIRHLVVRNWKLLHEIATSGCALLAMTKGVFVIARLAKHAVAISELPHS